MPQIVTIRTLLDARQAIAESQQRNTLPPYAFQITQADWDKLLDSMGGGSPGPFESLTICDTPVEIVDEPKI